MPENSMNPARMESQPLQQLVRMYSVLIRIDRSAPQNARRARENNAEPSQELTSHWLFAIYENPVFS